MGPLARPNRDYWLAKLRDAKNIASLETAQWSVMTVWECQREDLDELAHRLASFLGYAPRASHNASPSWYYGQEGDYVSRNKKLRGRPLKYGPPDLIPDKPLNVIRVLLRTRSRAERGLLK